MNSALRHFIRAVCGMTLIAVFVTAQQPANPPATGTIQGRVTLEKAPQPGVIMMLVSSQDRGDVNALTNVTGLTLSVSAMSSVAGKLVLEPAAQCKDARLSELDEITLRINFTVTLALNGAQLQGRVSTRPAAQVFLVPAEPEAQNNVLRFAETVAASDGSFAFANLAPGKYWLLACPAAKADEPGRQPIAWDATERAKLVKEAVAANQVVELRACQFVKGVEL